MITRALCILRRKRGYPYQYETEMHDSHGLAVGNEYYLNIDGERDEWTITKILTPINEGPNMPEPPAETETCSICQNTYTGYGHNAQPVNDGRCCEHCNNTVVIPARLQMIMRHQQGDA